MRKLTALLLALITSLSLAACSFVALPMDPEQPTNQKQEQLAEDGTYTTKEDVARYIHLYGHLPDNFITKKEAQQLGWTGGSLEPYAPGCCIGGSRFGKVRGDMRFQPLDFPVAEQTLIGISVSKAAL